MTPVPHQPLVGVGCVVVRAGRILLVRRQRAHGAGTWSPPGGHLDFGESPAACAAREVEEETGVHISRVEFLGVTNDIFADIGRHYVTIWMRGAPDASEGRVQDASEIGEVGWFAPDALPAPLFLCFSNFLTGRGWPSHSLADLVERAP